MPSLTSFSLSQFTKRLVFIAIGLQKYPNFLLWELHVVFYMLCFYVCELYSNSYGNAKTIVMKLNPLRQVEDGEPFNFVYTPSNVFCIDVRTVSQPQTRNELNLRL